MTRGATATYAEQFSAFTQNGGGAGPAWLPALRRRAFDRFGELGRMGGGEDYGRRFRL